MYKKIFLGVFFWCLAFPLVAQISLSDSSVQTVAYWKKGETYSFSVSLDEFKVVEKDTSERTTTRYTVDIFVLDSTENTYDVRWSYRDMSTDWGERDSLFLSIMDRISALKGGEIVEFRTDEYGSFIEMTNWEQIRDYYQIVSDSVSSEFSAFPEVAQLMKSMFGIYNNRNAIEKGVIKDVHQFLNFHGGAYRLNEPIKGKMQYPSVISDRLLDAEMLIELDKIYPEDNDYGIYSFVEVDREQLTNETREVLVKLLPQSQKEDIQKLMEQVGEVWDTTENFSIIHGSGWPTYSKETRQTGSNQNVKFEIRTIEMI
ncbi:MAG: hypothetical protein O9264_09125 [Leptospira sp.]|nr:hypothetical protein [Leptospira sp.]